MNKITKTIFASMLILFISAVFATIACLRISNNNMMDWQVQNDIAMGELYQQINGIEIEMSARFKKIEEINEGLYIGYDEIIETVIDNNSTINNIKHDIELLKRDAPLRYNYD